MGVPTTPLLGVVALTAITAVHAEVLHISRIAVNETAQCGERLDSFQSGSLLFVCDLGTQAQGRLLQTEKDQWGFLHYKPGVPMMDAKPSIPGMHRYVACYGDRSDAIADLLDECNEDNRDCASCGRAAEICYGDSNSFKVSQFYASGCDTDSNTMRVSRPFSERPEKQADAALFTFVLDELNKEKGGKLAGGKGFNSATKASGGYTKKGAPGKATDDKEDSGLPATIASWWSDLFPNAMSDSPNAVARTAHHGADHSTTEPAKGGNKAAEPAPPQAEDSASWWSSYLAEARGEKTLVPVPNAGKKKAAPAQSKEEAAAALSKESPKMTAGAQPEKGGSWWTDLFVETPSAPAAKAGSAAPKKPVGEKSVAAAPPAANAPWYSNIFDAEKPFAPAMKAAPVPSKSAATTLKKGAPVPAAADSKGPWYTNIFDAEKPATKAVAVPPKPATAALKMGAPAPAAADSKGPWYTNIFDAEKPATKAVAVPPKPVAVAPKNSAPVPAAADRKGPWYTNIFDAEKPATKAALVPPKSAAAAPKKAAPAPAAADSKGPWYTNIFDAEKPATKAVAVPPKPATVAPKKGAPAPVAVDRKGPWYTNIFDVEKPATRAVAVPPKPAAAAPKKGAPAPAAADRKGLWYTNIFDAEKTSKTSSEPFLRKGKKGKAKQDGKAPPAADVPSGPSGWFSSVLDAEKPAAPATAKAPAKGDSKTAAAPTDESSKGSTPGPWWWPAVLTGNSVGGNSDELFA